jgi:2-hydroxychromene-2-carboxylate isomerase
MQLRCLPGTVKDPSMIKQIEFYFDYVSPYSYLADSQLGALTKRTRALIIYRPVSLGGIFKATGNASPIANPAKGKYVRDDITRWIRRYRVPFGNNPHFPFNTLRLMRGAVAAQQQGRFDSLHPAAFRAMWVEGQNLADREVVSALLSRAGIEPSAIETEQVAAQLRANTDEAVRRGAFGVPTFFVGEEMFWGNDRLDFVEEAVTA